MESWPASLAETTSDKSGVAASGTSDASAVDKRQDQIQKADLYPLKYKKQNKKKLITRVNSWLRGRGGGRVLCGVFNWTHVRLTGGMQNRAGRDSVQVAVANTTAEAK